MVQQRRTPTGQEWNVDAVAHPAGDGVLRYQRSTLDDAVSAADVGVLMAAASSRPENDTSGLDATDSIVDLSSKKKKKHRTKDSVTVNTPVNSALHPSGVAKSSTSFS